MSVWAYIYIYIYAVLISLTLGSCLMPFLTRLSVLADNRLTLSKGLYPLYNALSQIFLFLGIEIPKSGAALILAFLCVIMFASFYCVSESLLRICLQRNLVSVCDRPEEKGRIVGVDVCKATGAIFVIIIHLYVEMGFYTRSMSEKVILPLSFFFTVLLSCVPLFITMTGFLMRNKKPCVAHYIGWFKYYFLYVVIELIIQLCYYCFGAEVTLYSVLKSISLFNNGYMSMFVGLYLLIPFLNKIWDGLVLRAKGGLIGVLVLLSIVPSVTGELFTKYWIALGALCYYFTGALFRDYDIHINKGVCLAGIFLCSVFETVYIYCFSAEKINNAFFWNAFNNHENTYYILPTFIITFLITALCVDIKKLPPLLNTFVKNISLHSFELYLLGLFMQTTLFGYARRYLNIDDHIFIWCALIGIIELLLSYIIGIAVRKISDKLFSAVFGKPDKKPAADKS